ncbi:MAG: hypothetical protein J5I98_07885 [Phaeodactylibacter sp.]|nr:hypothetical protein [Phaeodactylibacter sp.]
MHQPLLPKLAVLLSLAFSIPASRQALRFDTAGQAGDREAHLPAALPQVDLELEKSVDNITPNLEHVWRWSFGLQMSAFGTSFRLFSRP